MNIECFLNNIFLIALVLHTKNFIFLLYFIFHSLKFSIWRFNNTNMFEVIIFLLQINIYDLSRWREYIFGIVYMSFCLPNMSKSCISNFMRFLKDIGNDKMYDLILAVIDKQQHNIWDIKRRVNLFPKLLKRES